MFDRVSSTAFLLGALLLALGMVAGGYLLGDGLLRARDADRSVTVRGLSERDVVADLATWTLGYSAQGSDLAAVQADIASDMATIREFFSSLGAGANTLQPAGVNVSQYREQNGRPNITIRQRLVFRTPDIALASRAVERQFDLVAGGVVLEDGSVSYTFTDLESIKPAMVAEATRDARRAAEQFASDSGTRVGAIRTATQGYFSITARDGEGGFGADTPNKKVRVVTTVTFGLEEGE